MKERATARFKPGALIAGYRIVRDLGETNTGHLFHAEQFWPERDVRLLVLNHEFVEDAAARAQMEREVERIGAITHPNLLEIYGLETFENESFIVSEWTDGFSLLELLRARRELRATEVLSLLPQAAAAIDHASRSGIRRLELALHQIFIGFAQAAQPREPLLRAPVSQWPRFSLKLNPMSVTRELSASETWAGRQTIVSGFSGAPDAEDSPAKHIRALAGIVYELLGGTLAPFALQTSSSQRYSPIATLSERGNEVLKRALDPRGGGYATAHDFHSALSGVDGLEVERLEPKAAGSTPKVVSPPQRSAAVTAPVATRRRKIPVKFFGGVLTIAGVATAMYFFAQQQQPPKKEEEPRTVVPVPRPAPGRTETVTSSGTPEPSPPAPTPPEPTPPKPPTRQDLIQVAIEDANRHEAAKNWPAAINAWIRIMSEYPEMSSTTQLGMIFDRLVPQGQPLLEKTSGISDEEVKEKDLPLLRDLAMRAAQLEVINAMLFLGRSYVGSDLDSALKWYPAAAAKGNSTGMRHAGLILSHQGDASATAKAADYFQAASAQGDLLATYYLAECYLADTKGVKRDEKRAVELLQEASKRGSVLATGRLGICYEKGIGVRKNLSEAVRLFGEASRRGHTVSTGNLGVLYMKGEGVAPDPKRAAALFQEGVDKGDPAGACRYLLALCYSGGRGVPENPAKARALFQQAATLGHDKAAKWCDENDVDYVRKPRSPFPDAQDAQ